MSAVFIEELPINSYPSEELEEKNTYTKHEENNYGLIEPSDNMEDVFYAENSNKLCSLYLVCLANTSTTSHIFSQWEIFTDYHETPNTYVGGVGGNKTHAHGKETVTLLTQTKGTLRTIQLHDTLHIPDSRQNLISLGRWELKGKWFRAKQGTLMLYTVDDALVIQGERAINNLYCLHFHVQIYADNGTPDYAFNAMKISWETWHRHFGHIGYSGLSNLHAKKLVAGFDLDLKTPKPDCIPCTEAKMTRKPYPSTATHTTTVGALTHKDLWGKYDIKSPNKN